MKQLFTLPILCFLILLGNGIQAQTLYALLVADTGNPLKEFGDICRTDLGNMKKEIKKIADGGGYKLNMDSLSGNDFTTEKLMLKTTAIQPEEGDVFFFYYSGAAFCNKDNMDEKNRCLNMGPDGSDILCTEDLFQHIESKDAHLRVMFVDACSKLLHTRKIPGSRAGTEHKVYESLLSECGSIRIFSSRCSEYSYGDTRGSVFTNAFISAIDHFINIGSQSLTWGSLLDWAAQTAQQQVAAVFRNQHAKNFPVKCEP